MSAGEKPSSAAEKVLETTTTATSSDSRHMTGDGRYLTGDGRHVTGDTVEVRKPEVRKPFVSRLASCFDPRLNIKALNKTFSNSEFSHLAGLRVLSMAWVVLGHSFTFAFSDGVVSNLDQTTNILGSATFQIVASGQLAVDTFFVLSGFLLSRIGLPRFVKLFQVCEGETADGSVQRPRLESNDEVARLQGPRVGANSCLGSPVSRLGSPSLSRNNRLQGIPSETRTSVPSTARVSEVSAATTTGSGATSGATARPRLGLLGMLGVWSGMMIKRYLRLAPLFYFVMAVSYFGLEWVGDGPLWPLIAKFTRTGQDGGCKRWWWANILFVNNLLPPDAVFDCVGHSWYLANDLQFYFVGLGLLLIGCYELRFWKRPYLSCLLGLGMLLGSYVSAAISTIKYNFHYSMVQSSATLALDAHNPGLIHQAISRIAVSYVRPWNRIPPFLIGLAFGVFYASGMFQRFVSVPPRGGRLAAGGRTPGGGRHSGEDYENVLLTSNKDFQRIGADMSPKRHPLKRHVDRPTVWLLQAISLVIMLAMILPIPYQANRPDAAIWNRTVEIVYIATYRSIWSLCLGWMICSLVCPDPISRQFKNFLSIKVFSILALLSYGTYLVHPYVQSIFYAEGRHSIFLRESDQWFDALWHAISATAIAFLLWLFVELPFAKLLSFNL